MPTNKDDHEQLALSVWEGIYQLARDANDELLDLMHALGEWRTNPTRDNFFSVPHYATKLREIADGIEELCQDYHQGNLTPQK